MLSSLTAENISAQPRKRADRADHPVSSGLFCLIFCHADFKTHLPYRAREFEQFVDTVPLLAKKTKLGFTFNDIMVPSIDPVTAKLIPTAQKNHKIQLPQLVYSYLLKALAPEVDSFEEPNKVVFVFDAKPTFCLGLVSAVSAGYMYTVSQGSRLDATVVDMLVAVIIAKLDDETIKDWLNAFETHQALIAPSVPKGRNSSSGKGIVV